MPLLSLPVMTSASYFLAVAALIRWSGFPRAAIVLTYPAYQLWLAAWTGGLGLRLDIPMFPIRLDFAVPFVEPDHSEKEVFSFLVGYDF